MRFPPHIVTSFSINQPLLVPGASNQAIQTDVELCRAEQSWERVEKGLDFGMTESGARNARLAVISEIQVSNKVA